ncbi:ABC transporter permease [Nonomuraea sp. NPDC050547]|uniref:ABC transporter permease n=1 Tax=unclassified Nonomuraea TaxID=2593643 RepID=UPI0037A1EDDE
MIRQLSGVARVGLRLAFTYRSDAFMTSIVLVAQVLLLRMIWTGLYGARQQAGGLTLQELLVYLTLANLQAFAMNMTIGQIIHRRIRQGVVFFDLARPTAYLVHMAVLQVGNTFGMLLLLVPVVPLMLLIGSISQPVNLPAYLGTLVLGYVIGVMMALLICLVGFWTLETNGLFLLYRLMSQFFAGTMVPLSFFPGALGDLADLLPFKFMGYVPAAIYVGSVTEVSQALVVEAVWIVLLAGVLWLVWTRAHRRVVINGG